MEKKYMLEAIEEARIGIKNNHGGPFGAVIVKDGKVISRGHNQVILKLDPTLHGEMDAIKKACSELNTFDLSGCDIYTTGQPCPMCLAAIRWANIDNIYYGATIEDNEMIGFRDKLFFETTKEQTELGREECLELFKEYINIDNKTRY